MINVSPCQVVVIRDGCSLSTWVSVTSFPSAVAAEQSREPTGDGGLSMLGMRVGGGGIGVAPPDDLAVVASTANATVKVGGLGTAPDEG